VCSALAAPPKLEAPRAPKWAVLVLSDLTSALETQAKENLPEEQAVLVTVPKNFLPCFAY
jgi:hypothetical protein